MSKCRVTLVLTWAVVCLECGEIIQGLHYDEARELGYEHLKDYHNGKGRILQNNP